MWLASPFNALERTTRYTIQRKELSPFTPLIPQVRDGLDGRGLACGPWLIDLGSAVKPLAESKKRTSVCSGSGSGWGF